VGEFAHAQCVKERESARACLEKRGCVRVRIKHTQGVERERARERERERGREREREREGEGERGRERAVGASPPIEALQSRLSAKQVSFDSIVGLFSSYIKAVQSRLEKPFY